MPELLSETEVKLEWADLAKREPKRRPKNVDVRSSGWHLSGINRYVLQSIGKLTKEDESDEYPLRMAIGTAMEEYLVGFYPDLMWQSGERERDRVFCTPDGVSTLLVEDERGAREDVEDAAVIEEFKGATWKSRFPRKGNAILEERIWMWQLMGECAIMGLNYCQLHVVYIMGDYRGSGPQYFRYLIRFDDEEVERYWKNIVLANRDKAPKEEH